MIFYRYFCIDLYQRTPNQWRARITRTDGRSVTKSDQTAKVPFADTPDAPTDEEAIKLAKRMIDDGTVR
jgi:hypothetical protein